MAGKTPTVYMDESGDLGFDFSKHKTSRYFVAAFVFTSEPRQLDKIIKKIFAGFSKLEVKITMVYCIVIKRSQKLGYGYSMHLFDQMLIF